MNGMVRANSGNPKSRGRDEGIKWYRKERAEPGEPNAVGAGECPLAVCALEIRTPTFRTPVSHVSLSGKAWLSQSYMEPPPSLGHLCSVTLPVVSTEGFPTLLPWLLTALRAVLCAGPVLGLYIGA